MNAELYQQIIDHYQDSGSVKATAAYLHVSAERVRRTLITEGLWSSPSSIRIGELYAQRMTTEEIAKALQITVKNVQSYIPYSKGMYGGDSPDSARSAGYRKRKQTALAAQHERGQERLQDGAADAAPETFLPKPDALPFVSTDLTSQEAAENMEGGSEKMAGKTGRSGRRKAENPKKDTQNTQKNIPVYRLKIALEMEEDNAEKLLNLGECQKGISREILVPGDLTLHGLHYAILRLFGFNNGHLHCYRLSNETFDLLTGGSFMNWASLCGMYFRFPEGNYGDQYWDDDYDDSVSIRTWQRNKYRKITTLGAVGESYCMGQQTVREFIEDSPVLTIRPPFHLWGDDQDLPNEEKSISEASVEEVERSMVFEGTFDELAEKIRIMDLLYAEGTQKPEANLVSILREIIRMQMDGTRDRMEDSRVVLLGEEARNALEYASNLEQAAYYRKEDVIKAYGANYEDMIDYFQKDARRKQKAFYKKAAGYEPKVLPVTDTLYYAYDYGDDWRFSITCLEICESGDYYDIVQDNGGPVCIASDGGMLIDDVGGVYGYIDFLQKIKRSRPLRTGAAADGRDLMNEDFADEVSDNKYVDPTDDPEYLREWARGQGWTGRRVSLERML